MFQAETQAGQTSALRLLPKQYLFFYFPTQNFPNTKCFKSNQIKSNQIMSGFKEFSILYTPDFMGIYKLKNEAHFKSCDY